MKLIAFCLAVSAFMLCRADVHPRAVRLPIRHADPYYVKAMLEAVPVIQPEIGTLIPFNPQAAAIASARAGANAIIKGGHFLVNPTDNSLWFYFDDFAG